MQVSGSVQDALSKRLKGAGTQEKVEAPKFFGAGLKLAQAVTGVSGGAGVLPDLNKCKRPSKTLVLYEYEGSPFCKKVTCGLVIVAHDLRRTFFSHAPPHSHSPLRPVSPLPFAPDPLPSLS